MDADGAGGTHGAHGGREARLFEAWCVPAWADAPPDVAVRVLPPARTRAGDTPDTALAVPDLRPSHADALIRALRHARTDLLERPVAEIADVLGRVGARFLDEGDPLRREALELLPGTTGLSEAMCREVLDGMARDWTAERLHRLLRTDFPDPGALDGFVPTAVGGDGGTDAEVGTRATEGGGAIRVRVLGAAFAFHVCAGSVPGVSATSLVRSLLVKSPVLLKPGRGDVVLPTLFLRALAEEDATLAGAAAVLYWPGGSDPGGLEAAALEAAELVVAYGGDDLVRELRGRISPTTRLVTYHHRLSFAVIGRMGLEVEAITGVAERTARAVATFDQRGCVSPHVVFVESDETGADRFADALANALEALEASLPSGRMSDAEASALQQLRGTDDLRAAAGEGVSVRAGGGARWTVVLEPGAGLVPSCLCRTVRVAAVADVEEVAERVAGLDRHLQTVGVEGIDAPRLAALAETLARRGALRIVPLEEVVFPPAWWRHDGRGPLDALVRRVELEE